VEKPINTILVEHLPHIRQEFHSEGRVGWLGE